MDALVDVELEVDEHPDGGFVATYRAFPDLVFREPTPEAAANVLAASSFATGKEVAIRGARRDDQERPIQPGSRTRGLLRRPARATELGCYARRRRDPVVSRRLRSSTP